MNHFGKGSIRLAGLVFLSAVWALAQTNVGQPGAVNYVEGSVSVNGRALNSRSVGSAQVQPGQTIATAQGRAEILLTPGVFVRIGDHSSLEMVAASLTDTEVQLDGGHALIEVDQIEKENHLAIHDNGFTTTIEKRGIYAFDTAPAAVSVYDGKAVAQVGDRQIEAFKGQRVALAAGTRKTQKFDRKQTDELYAWSKLRSEYMAEASAASAQNIIVNSPGWWYGTGWYWNPWFDSWAFVPGGGYLWGPFGYGFFSPGYAYYAPYYRGYWGAGYGYRGFHGPVGRVGGFRASAGPAFHGGFAGGFHGGRR